MITEIKERTFVYEGTVYTVADIKKAIDKIGMSDIPAISALDMLLEFLNGFHDKEGEIGFKFESDKYEEQELLWALFPLDEEGDDNDDSLDVVIDGQDVILKHTWWVEEPYTEEELSGDWIRSVVLGDTEARRFNIGSIGDGTLVLNLFFEDWYFTVSDHLKAAFKKLSKS